MKKSLFGKTSQNEDIYLYKLKNSNCIEVEIINYGCIITSIKIPDKNGNLIDIVLGYDNLNDYINDPFYFGCIVGRYANRINKGLFKLNQNEYTLNLNNGENHLHGGLKGFNKVVWESKIVEKNNLELLELKYLSKDGEENYPANLNTKVTYSLTNDNELIIDYFAKSCDDTIINLTNHSYFNLLGKENILNHKLMINSDKFTMIDENLIPTGEMKELKNSPLDFSKEFIVGSRINENYEQLLFTKGYDHNFIINQGKNSINFAAKLLEPNSGRTLEVFTTKPGLQFYSGNFLNNVKGKNNQIYDKHSGLCLETQFFPDSPNKPNFPTCVLKKDEEYKQRTIYKFKCF